MIGLSGLIFGLLKGVLKPPACWVGFLVMIVLLFAKGQAQELTLEGVIQKAIDTSYDVKIAQKDIELSQNDVTITRADYFPTVQSRLNVEYLKDLEDAPRPVTAVGNTVIPAGTRYQNSVGISVNHDLLDFGIRNRKMTYARKDVIAKAAAYDQTLRDLQLTLVDLYTAALLNSQAIKANEAILTLAQQGYQMKKRLYDAGTSSKVDVATEAIQVAQSMDDIESLKYQLAQNLQNISQYTQEVYDIETTTLAALGETPDSPEVHFQAINSPEARNYDAQIDMKQQEIEILKRQALPRVSLYSYYNLYGFDPEQLSKSVQNLSQRTVSVGLSVAMPVFDGFKNRGLVQKARLEKEKLVLQRTKVLAELQHEADTLVRKIDTHGVLLKTKATILNKTQDKLTLETRLSDQQLIDKTQAVQDHIARIRRQLDTEKSLVEGISARKKLAILEAGG